MSGCPSNSWVTHGARTNCHGSCNVCDHTPILCLTDIQSLALALYFASRGKGQVRGTRDAAPVPYISEARVLLNGLGSDELLGGYGRHRSVYNTGTWEAVISEVSNLTTATWYCSYFSFILWIVTTRNRKASNPKFRTWWSCYLITWKGNAASISLSYCSLLPGFTSYSLQVGPTPGGRLWRQDVAKVSCTKARPHWGELSKKKGHAVWKPLCSDGRGKERWCRARLESMQCTTCH